MARLDHERVKELTPKRTQYAKNALKKAGYQIAEETDKKLVIIFKEKKVTLYPFTGWFTGKTVKDGRGISNLVAQIKKPDMYQLQEQDLKNIADKGVSNND